MSATREDLIETILGLYWQFGYDCSPDRHVKKGGEILHTYKPYRHSGGMSDLEEAEAILLDEGRIEKYRKNGRMEWYKPVVKEEK